MLNFPTNPQDRQIYPFPQRPGTSSFVYDAQRGIWNRLPVTISNNSSASAESRPFIFSDTAPAARPNLDPLQNGDLWFNTDQAITYVYYVDSSTNQWVQI